MIIDSHTHAWEYWPYEPPVPDHESRGRVEQLLWEMDRSGVDVSVLVCARIEHNPRNNDYVAGWLATVGVLQALKRRAVEGGSYKVVVSLSKVTLWLMSMGIFDKAYAAKMAGSADEHTYVAPDQFSAVTPLGLYTGVTEQVVMTETPGRYRFVLEPRGAAQPQWL